MKKIFTVLTILLLSGNFSGCVRKTDAEQAVVEQIERNTFIDFITLINYLGREPPDDFIRVDFTIYRGIELQLETDLSSNILLYTRNGIVDYVHCMFSSENYGLLSRVYGEAITSLEGIAVLRERSSGHSVWHYEQIEDFLALIYLSSITTGPYDSLFTVSIDAY